MNKGLNGMSGPKVWFLAMRPQFFPAIVIPVTLGSIIAWSREDVFNSFYFVLSLFAGLLYHGGVNVLNDYFDHINGTDDLNETPLTPYAGGSRMIQKGILDRNEVLILSAVLLISGSLIGLFLAFISGFWLIPIGLIGLFSGIFYSAPPLSLSSRGLGEALVGLNFGILSVLGAYYVQAQGFDIVPVLISLPISFLITAVLYINEFPDYRADKKAGKLTLVVRMGRRRARLGFLILLLSAILSIVTGVAFNYMPFIAIFSAVPVLFGFKGVKILYNYFDDEKKLLPAMKTTISTYTLTGVFLCLAYVLAKAF